MLINSDILCWKLLDAAFTPNRSILLCLIPKCVANEVMYLLDSSSSSWWKALLMSSFIKTVEPIGSAIRLSIGCFPFSLCLPFSCQHRFIHLVPLEQLQFPMVLDLLPFQLFKFFWSFEFFLHILYVMKWYLTLLFCFWLDVFVNMKHNCLVFDFISSCQ